MSDLVKPAVLFGEEEIRERILDIGRGITADYDGSAGILELGKSVANGALN